MTMSKIRLQKFLAQAGVCSRRRGEKHILDGHVRVNGDVESNLGSKVDPLTDRVEFCGKIIKTQEKKIYIALNKPKGYVTSCRQPGARVVSDIVNIPDRVVPVGRLDKDSTGLLILTNDGDLHNALTHPSFDHEKEYDVTVKQTISDPALQRMAAGLKVLGKKTRPAKIKRISDKRFLILLKEGRNRQIRRMTQMVGNDVARLKRIRISGVNLGNLEQGTWRHLTEKEVANLRQSLRPDRF